MAAALRYIYLTLQNDKKREIQRRELGKNVAKFKQQRVSESVVVL